MKIACIFGTRPEVIKMAMVIKKLKEHGHEVISISTGQHKEILEQTMSVFSLKSDINLNVMTHNQKIHDVMSISIQKLGQLFIEIKPDLVIGQGDTTTALAASMASYFNKIDFAHVEAGLRTYDPDNPWPEEINRTIISKLSKIHFCPTKKSAINLNNEKIFDNVYVTGNTVVDSLMSVIEHRKTKIKNILCTIHRRENFGINLNKILDAIIYIVSTHKEIEVTIPVHPNPNIKNTINQRLKNVERIHLCEPMDYKQFCQAMSESYFIITDSGGVQEEAPALGKPVLVLRKHTERPEAVELGLVKLVGSDTQTIINEASKLINCNEEYEKMSKIASPYGDGMAAERISVIIKEWFDNKTN